MIDKPAGWHSVSGAGKSKPAAARVQRGKSSTSPPPTLWHHCHDHDHDHDDYHRHHDNNKSQNIANDKTILQKEQLEMEASPSPSNHAPSIQDWLLQQEIGEGLPESGLVNRLDLGTSGCLVCARTAKSHASLRKMMSGRGDESAQKLYLALTSAHGHPTGEGRFRLLFGSRRRGSSKVTVVPDAPGRRKGVRGALQGECAWQCISEGGRRQGAAGNGVAAYAVEGPKPPSAHSKP